MLAGAPSVGARVSVSDRTLILGAGMTGLAAGMASGLPVLEAAAHPGGICCSYYLVRDGDEPLAEPPEDEDAYRFEIGGGHWLFGGEATVLRFIAGLGPVNRHERRSSVYFPDTRRYVPYPIQNHLRFFDHPTITAALGEMARPQGPVSTMADWLVESFGDTLNRMFFAPFHDLYTAGLYTEIAPQDAYKSPVDLSLALRGAFTGTAAVGYNTTFVYPQGGLDLLARRMASRCRVAFDQRVVRIDVEERVLTLADGTTREYHTLLSTLPLNRVVEMAGLSTAATPDPFTSVLVVNLGGTKGDACPDDHWLYLPHSEGGFHRVGFYSNVDASFLPASARDAGDRVSMYVERSFRGGERPSDAAIEHYCVKVVEELRDWGFIERAEAVHPTWIDVAYTWSWPGSRWAAEALRILEDNGVYQLGRYGRWRFQGIADSIRDGFVAGSSFRTFPTGNPAPRGLSRVSRERA
jgi:protoporphyrinogen oxidase